MVPGDHPEGHVDFSKLSIDRLSVMDDDELARLVDGNHWNGKQLMAIADSMPDGPCKQAFQQRLTALVPAPPKLSGDQATAAAFRAQVTTDHPDRFADWSSAELIADMATPRSGTGPRIPLQRGRGVS